MNTLVFAVGRSTGSGTRVTALAETGFGVFQNVVQVTVNSDANNSVTGYTDVGNSGYSGGGAEAVALTKAATVATGYAVGYLGVEDFNAVVAGFGKKLTYDGVDFSIANVQNGNYTFWGYEHMYYTPGLREPN
ncbi:MAG: hypothetical protein ACR2NX_09610 [Chthoniobacterales bacterium]